MKTTAEIAEAGYCSGCGVCAGVCPAGALTVEFNRFGEYAPTLDKHLCTDCRVCLRVCPFSDLTASEDTMARRLYANQAGSRHDHLVGYYRNTYVAHANDEKIRLNAASGGVTTLILTSLLEQGRADFAACVLPDSSGGPGLFSYRLVNRVDKVLSGSRSVYYPVEASSVLGDIMALPQGRVALVGLPCGIRAIRNSVELLPGKFAGKELVLLGLTCGSMRSKAYTEYVLKKSSGDPRSIRAVTYRIKRGEGKSSDYGYRYRWKNAATGEVETTSVWKDGISKYWNDDYFKLNACAFCDDVFAELADISLMDAWMPEYIDDWRGHNLVVTRTGFADEWLARLSVQGLLTCDRIEIDKVIQSHGWIIRNKRQGVQYRLWKLRAENRWAPRKRVPYLRTGTQEDRSRWDYTDEVRRLTREVWARDKDDKLVDRAIARIRPADRSSTGTAGTGGRPGRAPSRSRRGTPSPTKGGARVLLVAGNQGVVNKGAETMVRTVKAELGKRVDGVHFFMERSGIPKGTEDQVLRLGVNIVEREVPGKLSRIVEILGLIALHPGLASRILSRRHLLWGWTGLMRDMDAVIDVSGYRYGETWGLNHILPVLPVAARAWLGRKPHIFLPQAWGPFKKRTDLFRLCRWMCSRAALLCARDAQSRGYLAELLNRPAAEIPLTPDIAFRYSPTTLPEDEIWKTVASLKTKGRLVGIVPNMRVYERSKKDGDGNRHIDLLVGLCNCLADEGHCVLLLPHEVNPREDKKDDRYLCRTIAQLVDKPGRVLAVDRAVDADYLKAMISRCELIVSSRYHAIVAALELCRPVVVIGWSHKYEELLRDVGLSEFMLDSDVEADRLAEVVAKALRESDRIGHRLEQTIPILRGRVDEAFDRVSSLLSKTSERT